MVFSDTVTPSVLWIIQCNDRDKPLINTMTTGHTTVQQRLSWKVIIYWQLNVSSLYLCYRYQYWLKGASDQNVKNKFWEKCDKKIEHFTSRAHLQTLVFGMTSSAQGQMI